MYPQCHKYCDFNCKICIALNDGSIIKSMHQRIANKSANKWSDISISMKSIDKAQLLVDSETWYIT